MGGGAAEVPNYKTYDNWRNYPKLVEHEARLARMGLKDPWIRNIAWMYAPDMPHGQGGPYWHARWFVRHVACKGIYAGLAIAAGLVVVDEAYMLYNKGHVSWNKPAHH